MAELLRVKANWSGFTGAPGVTVLHTAAFVADRVVDATNSATAARTFLNSFGSILPSVVSIQVDPEVEVIEDTTGELIEVVNIAQPALIQGGSTAVYAGPTGAVVNWSTQTVRRGRRMRGRTFLVPLTSAAYQADGTLVPTALTTIRTAADAYVNTADILPVIFGRPTVNQADGMNGPITASNVPDMAAVLRSRRD